MNEQKERLERELKFLRESLEAGVISKEEYVKGKERIEKRLEEIPAEETSEEEIEIKEIEEKKEIELEKPEVEEEIKEELEEEKKEEREEELEIEGEELEEKPKEEKGGEEFLVINKKALLVVGIIALIVVAYFLIKIPGKSNEKPMAEIKPPIKEEPIIEPLCITDDDCKKEGKIGICQNPGTEEASCLFKDPIKVGLTVINDEDCVSCDTSRMIGVLRQLFLDVDVNQINHESEEAKKIISELRIKALPAYIVDSRVNETIRFDKFERALTEAGDNYIISPTASGANYFFDRNEIKNKLELFTLLEDTQKIEDNVGEVLDLFKDKIIYSKKIVSESEKESLKKEFAITTYPTFLVNNRLKFSGIQPAETIKEKFCELNELDECKTILSKDIKN